MTDQDNTTERQRREREDHPPVVFTREIPIIGFGDNACILLTFGIGIEGGSFFHASGPAAFARYCADLEAERGFPASGEEYVIETGYTTAIMAILANRDKRRQILQYLAARHPGEFAAALMGVL